MANRSSHQIRGDSNMMFSRFDESVLVFQSQHAYDSIEWTPRERPGQSR